MRTSSQLRRSDDCEFNPRIKISQHNKAINLAIVQKQIIKRILMGEPIDDIRSELVDDSLEFIFRVKGNSPAFSTIDFMSKLEKIEGVKDVGLLNTHKF